MTVVDSPLQTQKEADMVKWCTGCDSRTAYTKAISRYQSEGRDTVYICHECSTSKAVFQWQGGHLTAPGLNGIDWDLISEDQGVGIH